jgi:hypothetical protein
MASFPVRWWRTVLAFIRLNHDSANNGWVEPGNEITRAILSGRTISLGAPKPVLTVSAPAVEFAPIAPAAEEEVALPAIEVTEEVETPAAGTPTRRRAGRAA